MSVRVLHDDMLAVIPRLVGEGVACDACVTDPPYHLIQVSRGGSLRQNDPAKPFGRAESRGGFMGQTWDGGDIAFRPETWATVATVLRPGAFLVAFGGTRTYHRLVCAIEDAGFVIQDTIAWLYGSGFPKRRDMLKPAFEPIVVAYKPGGKRTLQVEECRIHTEGSTGRQRHGGGIDGAWREFTVSTAADKYDLPDGRWPANVCHDGSEEVLEAFPDAPGQQGDVSGTEPSQCHSGVYSGPKRRLPFNRRVGEASAERRYTEETGFALMPGARRSDAGSAARFFYCAKADKQDRWGSRHPTVKTVELMKWLVPLVTPAGGLVLDPFAGSGTTGVAALATGRDCILVEREAQYHDDIRERMAFYEGGGRHSVAAKNRSRAAVTGPLL